MGLDIIDNNDGKACFHCNTTGWAFGPVGSCYEQMEAFQKYLEQWGSVRSMDDVSLQARWSEFLDGKHVNCIGCDAGLFVGVKETFGDWEVIGKTHDWDNEYSGECPECLATRN